MSEEVVNATPIVSKVESSDYKIRFPGEKLTASEITHGQRNNILHVAVKYRGSGKVESILKSHPLLALETNAKGDNPLHIAARLGRLDVVERIVEYEEKRLADTESGYSHGQDKDKKLMLKVNNKGNTALHEALLNGHCDIAELLIKKDPALTRFDNKKGESPLSLAVEGGYQKIALQILDTFPDCSISVRNGLTIMHQIVICTQPDHFVGKVLEKVGPEVLVTADDFGWMPHHHAANMGFSRILERLLMTSPLLASIPAKHGMSALHISAKNGHNQVIKTLIKECPDICELVDDKGWTALHVAVEHKQTNAVRTLLNTIAFNDLVNEQDNEGNTALHLACTCGTFEIIMCLLAYPRTNKRIINDKGMTAFDILNKSSILGPFEKPMIKSLWMTRNPNSLQEILAVRDAKERQIKVPSIEEQIKRPSEDKSVESTQKKGASIEENKSRNEDKIVEKVENINLLVATIIVSVTFAAATAVPGGYESSNGLANFREQAWFRFDLIAFGFSALSMTLSLVLQVQSIMVFEFQLSTTTLLNLLSIIATICALFFWPGTVLDQHKAMGLGNIAYLLFSIIVLCCFLLVYYNYTKGMLLAAMDNFRFKYIN